MQTIISIFNASINYKQLDESIIEHIITTLCIVQECIDIVDVQPLVEFCFEIVLRTEYKDYAINYMIDLLKGKQRVLVKAFGKKKQKQEGVLEYLYRLSSASCSKFTATNLDLIWSKEKNENEWQKEFSKRLYTGIIKLLSVLLLLLLAYSII